jgi:hypothetical protein
MHCDIHVLGDATQLSLLTSRPYSVSIDYLGFGLGSDIFRPFDSNVFGKRDDHASEMIKILDT